MLSFRPRDALLAVPILGIPALAACVGAGLPPAVSFAFAAASGVSLAAYAAIEFRHRTRGPSGANERMSRQNWPRSDGEPGS